MPFYQPPSALILRALETAPNMYLILSPDLNILTASDLYLEATQTSRELIVGKYIFDAFPDNPDWEGANGVQQIRASLQDVLRTGKPHKMPIQKYDVPDQNNPGRFIERYWDPSHTPVFDDEGELSYIIQLATNVTEQVLAEREAKQARQKISVLDQLENTLSELTASNEELYATNEELAQSQEQLQQTFDQLEASNARTKSIVEGSPFPIGVYIGREMRIEYANEAIIRIWGKGADVMGKSYHELLPELAGQGIYEQLDKVLTTGVPFHARNQRVDLEVSGELQVFYFNYSFTPLAGPDGLIYGVLNTGADVTDVVTANQKLADSEQELQAINEEFQLINENLSEANDELRLFNEEVSRLNTRLGESESDFRRLVDQSPVAILVFRGPEMIIDLANGPILEILGKDESIIGQALLEGMPELKGEPAVELLFDIYHKGISSDGHEVPVKMLRNGEVETRYFNFSYRPLKDNDRIIGVMDIAVEVTGQVKARKAIEWAEEQLRLAIDSAELATWLLDAETGEFFPSVRLKELFGYRAEEEMPLEAGIEQIMEPYRERVRQAIENTITTGAVYDIEYQVEGFHDRKLRWLRARGRLYRTEENKAGNFYGVMTDITEAKLLEQRKDDFLSIASHELKTPLTSLKSTLQLMDRLKDKPPGEINLKLIGQANRSMDRITHLIDDLLQVNRLDVGQLPLNKTSFVIAQLLAKCCNHVRVAGKHKLIVHGDKQLIIHADEHRIDQVVVNLVDNAVKYAPASREIFLVIETIAGFAKISVKDNGPGIPADKIPFLFDRYYRAEQSAKGYSGLGLGLYICAEIIKRHGGEMGVDTKPGQGSSFWFTLPLT
jgi:PAS domain S-box-containing protein